MKICKVCSLALPSNLRSFCSAGCKKVSEQARSKARYQADRLGYIQRAAEWKRDNREASRESGRRTAAKTKDAKRVYDVAYRAENRQRYSDHQRDWYSKNSDHARDAGREYASRRRARINKNGAYAVSAKDYARLLTRSNNACAYCRTPLGRAIHWDHIVPISRGGSHSVGNLAPSCAPCNQGKSSKLLIEWQGRDSDPGLMVFDVTPDGFDLSSLTILTA